MEDRKRERQILHKYMEFLASNVEKITADEYGYLFPETFKALEISDNRIVAAFGIGVLAAHLFICLFKHGKNFCR